jgi:NADH:ubiquinone reductase (non-electrogenic)
VDRNNPRLVVLGTGFGGFSLLKELKKGIFSVSVVSPRNHFLFTPLLPSTTVGTLEFRSIIEPVRKAVPQIQYIQANCTRVDPQGKTIVGVGFLDGHTFTLPYDILVIAVGAVNNTFNIPGVEQHALFLKELIDARTIRQRIIDCFERAAQPSLSDDQRKRLLQFIVVGGGPTGVEFAAELHDFVAEDLRKPYTFLMPHVKIVLLEAGASILTTFDKVLSEYTASLFRRQHIEVRTHSPVTEVKPEAIVLKDGTSLPYGLIVWSTGIGPTPLVQSLPFPKDQANRLLTDEWFRIKATNDIYALGDCATFETRDFPATSQVAQQQGRYLARALQRSLQGKHVNQFRYHHFGMLAYVGSNRALADLSSVKGHGLSTWIFWRSAYLTKLVSLKNKLLVLFDWFKTFVFGRDISRF